MSLSVPVTILSPILSSVDSVLAMPPLADLCSDPVPKIACQVVEPAYLPPLASNTLLVPSRLAFLQRSASGTVSLRLS